MTALARSIALLAASSILAGAHAQCAPDWSDAFAYLGAPRVDALALFDPDGDGPGSARLVVSGQFSEIGGIAASNIAAWDGRRWFPLGAGLNEPARAMTVIDPDGDGPLPPVLFVGGWFTSAGGGPVSHVARWDGQAWSALGEGVNDAVFALARFDPDGAGPQAPLLAAGGQFSQAGAKPASRVALWDGATWSRLDTGVKGPSVKVDALVEFDDDGDGVPALIVGGHFSTAGGLPVTGLAKWEGSWSPFGEPLLADDQGASVAALEVADPDGDGPIGTSLLIGGRFSGTVGATLNNVARYDAGAWAPLGNGLTSGGCYWGGAAVADLEVFDSDGPGPVPQRLIAIGSFCLAPPEPARNAAAWDGATWTPLTPDLEAGNYSSKSGVVALPEGLGSNPDPLLAIGGTIVRTWCAEEGVVLWDGARMLRLGNGLTTEEAVFHGAARSGAAFDPDGDGPELPALVVVGGFAGHIVSMRAGSSQWMGANVEGDEWQNGWCFPTEVSAAATWDDDGAGPRPESLFVSGRFGSIADLSPEHHVVAWNMEAGWHEIGGSSSPPAYALLVLDIDEGGPEPESLYAAGDFTDAGDAPAGRIARWDGQHWMPLGDGIGNGTVHALNAFDLDGQGPLPPSLIAAGEFATAGGQPASNIAAWDGQGWVPLGAGLASPVHGLCLWDRDGDGPEDPILIAGQRTGEVAAWDGQDWSTLGKADGQVHAVRAFSTDGAGPDALFAAGNFAAIDAMPAANIARLDDAGWSALGAGIDGAEKGFPALRGVNALVVHDDDGAGPIAPALYVLGFFTHAGGHPSDLIARWGCPLSLPCTADCTADGVLDFFDFVCFINLFNTADPAADCDASGGLDLFDFLCFVNAFNAGC